MEKPKSNPDIREKIVSMAESGKPFQRYDVMVKYFCHHHTGVWNEELKLLVSEGVLSIVKTLDETDFEGKKRKVYQLKEATK